MKINSSAKQGMGSQLLPAVGGGAKSRLQKTFHLQTAAQLCCFVDRKVRETNPLGFMFGTFSPGCADEALRVQRLPIWGAVVKAQVARHSSEAAGGFPS